MGNLAWPQIADHPVFLVRSPNSHLRGTRVHPSTGREQSLGPRSDIHRSMGWYHRDYERPIRG